MRPQRCCSPRRRNSQVTQSPFYSPSPAPQVRSHGPCRPPARLSVLVHGSNHGWPGAPWWRWEPPATVPSAAGGGFLPPLSAAHCETQPSPRCLYSSFQQTPTENILELSDPVLWHSTRLQTGCEGWACSPPRHPLFCQPGLQLETPQISSCLCLSGSARARSAGRWAGSPVYPPRGRGGADGASGAPGAKQPRASARCQGTWQLGTSKSTQHPDSARCPGSRAGIARRVSPGLCVSLYFPPIQQEIWLSPAPPGPVEEPFVGQRSPFSKGSLGLAEQHAALRHLDPHFPMCRAEHRLQTQLPGKSRRELGNCGVKFPEIPSAGVSAPITSVTSRYPADWR